MKFVTLVASVALATVGTVLPKNASADIQLTLLSTHSVLGGVDYTYGANLSQEEQLKTSVQPNFFTLYDFGPANLIGTTGDLSAGWTFVTNVNQSTSAEGVVPSNNPAIDDVRATYTSSTVITGPSLGDAVDNLGTFTLFTTDTGPFEVRVNDQDAQAVKYVPGEPTNNTPTSNLAAVAEPTISVPVPEPATIGLLGVGLVGLGLLRRRVL